VQPILAKLLKAELAEREVRSITYQMKVARFPTFKIWLDSTFAKAPSTKAWSGKLHGCEFMEKAHNVVMVGGPGTGKTHLRHGYRSAGDTTSSSPGALPCSHRAGK
jgi:DNA replication protein DnaC